MQYWCIKYRSKTEGEEVIKHFFCFAETKMKAVERFCKASENSRRCIVSVYRIGV